MYGDVGYGLLLLLMALVLMRLGKRDWGLIWLMTSFAVIAFGLYYGDFFGIRLWGNGVEYTYMTGIAAALLFGFYIMLIAFLLKIANLILAGEIDAALGVYAPIAVLYAAIGSLTLRLINMPLDVPGLGLLLGITNYARELLYVGSAWVMAGPIAVGLRYGLSHMRVIGNEMALALIEVFISATANILSFARLEIVHIAHGFFSASAKALLGIPGGIALYIVVQLLIAAFEGFLTTIQSLRLIYYETLSKFYRGAGRLFEPQSL
nr:MAG: hypothetical protein TU35_09495 [Thermoproteus sp. AZ2]